MDDERHTRGRSWLICASVLALIAPLMYFVIWGLAISLAGRWATRDDIARQSLPSMNANRGELQYFPPGPELRLKRQVSALHNDPLRQQVATETEQSSDDSLPPFDDLNEGDAKP